MLFTSTKDWKQYLTAEDEERLNDILKKASKYRGAYKNADEIKIAQLWCTILDLRKENAFLQRKIARLEDLLEGMFSKIRKEERDRMSLKESLEKF